MDDLPAVKICQAMQDSLGDLSKHFLARTSTELLDLFVYTIQRAAFAEFHGNRDCGGGLVHEGAIVLADVFRGAVLVELEFSQNLFLDIWVRTGGDDLSWVSIVGRAPRDMGCEDNRP